MPAYSATTIQYADTKKAKNPITSNQPTMLKFSSK